MNFQRGISNAFCIHNLFDCLFILSGSSVIIPLSLTKDNGMIAEGNNRLMKDVGGK